MQEFDNGEIIIDDEYKIVYNIQKDWDTTTSLKSINNSIQIVKYGKYANYLSNCSVTRELEPFIRLIKKLKENK